MDVIHDSPVLLVAFSALLGLIVGSFLNVVTYRVPLMMRRGSKLSLFSPRSHCPQCQHILSIHDTIPLLSYTLTRGKCRYCNSAISPRYPLIEAGSALLSMALAWQFGPTLSLLAALCLTWSLIALATIDLTHFLLPDTLTLPLLWLGLACNLFDLFTPLPSAVFGAMLGYLLLWSQFHLFKRLTGKTAIGHGDFKLLAAIGAWLGYQCLAATLVLSAATAIVIRLLLFRQHKHRYFAFGPYLCFASVVMLFWQHYPQ